MPLIVMRLPVAEHESTTCHEMLCYFAAISRAEAPYAIMPRHTCRLMRDTSHTPFRQRYATRADVAAAARRLLRYATPFRVLRSCAYIDEYAYCYLFFFYVATLSFASAVADTPAKMPYAPFLRAPRVCAML